MARRLRPGRGVCAPPLPPATRRSPTRKPNLPASSNAPRAPRRPRAGPAILDAGDEHDRREQNEHERERDESPIGTGSDRSVNPARHDTQHWLTRGNTRSHPMVVGYPLRSNWYAARLPAHGDTHAVPESTTVEPSTPSRDARAAPMPLPAPETIAPCTSSMLRPAEDGTWNNRLSVARTPCRTQAVRPRRLTRRSTRRRRSLLAVVPCWQLAQRGSSGSSVTVA